MMCGLWCLFFVLICVSSNVGEGSNSFRLSKHVIPETYEIKLDPHLDHRNFSGDVQIFLRVKKAVDVITLHSYNLSIEYVELDYNKDGLTFSLDPEVQFLYIMYENGEDIVPGEHTLYIKFSGNMTSSVGFYTYRERNTTLVASKMSQIYARQVFPCFDEPSFKAKFNVRLVKPDDTYTALSNMKHIRSYITSNGIIEEFQTSVKMSSYLVAFVLTNLNYSETTYEQDGENIPIRLYSQGTDSDREFPLKVARQVMEYFVNYTDIPYPLSKLDMLEVPNYRSRGMEHWGLIIYHKNTVVYRPKSSPVTKLRFLPSAALLIAHEISHFHFGNLVTHSWYSDLWLTEGFAKYMEFKAINEILPEWKIMDYMPKTHGHYVYWLDQSKTISPVVSQVNRISNIVEKYKGVLYSKGGMILRMINNVVGEEKFQSAIRTYLKKYQYSSVSTGDFIDILQDVEPDINMFSFLETWLYHNKYPILEVVEDDTSQTFNITQQCIPEVEENSTEVCSHKWTIPIFYISSKTKEPQLIWFDKEVEQLIIPKEEAEWIKLNHDEIAIYRTNYQMSLWEKLTKSFKDLDPTDQANLINDAFTLYTEDMLPCEVGFNLVQEMAGVVDNLPWSAVRDNFPFEFLDNEEDRVIIKEFYESVGAEAYKELSWEVEERDSLNRRFARVVVLEFLCLNLEYIQCLKDVKLMTMRNATVHNDVSKVYERINELRNTTKEVVNRTEIPERITSCSEWIRTTLAVNIRQHNETEDSGAPCRLSAQPTVSIVCFLVIVLSYFHTS